MLYDSSVGSVTYGFIVLSADSSCRILSLGNEESQYYMGVHLSFFYLHGYFQVTFINFWTPHPLSDCSPEWHSHFRLHIVAQWCYWWWFSTSRALTKHGLIKHVIASALHWRMISCSTTGWWKTQGWTQGHFPSSCGILVWSLNHICLKILHVQW